VNESRDPRRGRGGPPGPASSAQHLARRDARDLEPWVVTGLVSHRDVIDALRGAVVVTDPDGHIVLWSAAAEHLYGWTETEVLGRSVLDVLAPPTDLPANRDDLAFVAAGHTKTGDRVVARRDGSAIQVNTVTRPLLDGDGAIIGIVGWSDEITALRLAEQRRLAAMAVEAAGRERLHRERLEFLGAVNDALSTSSTLPELMRSVTRTAVRWLGDWCSIHVLPFTSGSIPEVEVAAVDPAMAESARVLRTRFPYDPDARFGVARVIRTGHTEFYPDITDQVLDELDATDELRDVIGELDLGSTIAVPLRKRGRVLGALQIAMSSASRRYTRDDVTLAHSVAARIASSIENLRLYEQQRLIARTLQRSLLPAALPVIPGVELAVRYWPAGEGNDVGGDFYDVFPLDHPGEWAVVIGDVCGTGPAAAALTGLARHSIRDSAWHGDTPVEVLRSLDRAVKRSATRSFLTAVYATLDTSRPRLTLTVASGGHPLPLHLDGDAASVVEIGTPGTLLGMLDCARFDTETRDLEPGDVIVFYTDGATDVPPPHGLDRSQYIELVRRAVRRGGTAEAIADQIRDALEAVLAFDHRNDDIALLVLCVAGPRRRS
jgi:PAS domain S-box-containing protein